MSKRKASDRKASRLALSGLVAALMVAGVSAPAQARHHHRAVHHAHHGHPHHQVAAAAAGVGGTAAIVVDGATGRMIYGMNENAPRHPASVTKVMTLYLLFEALEKGKLGLDDDIPISAHAAAQAPSKLGLRPSQTIRVEDAIKAIVTKSANDIAVAVAEAVGGTESDFAEMMTRKAHALGMTRTVYRNASGLPNDEQITTAADLALLGRSIQANYPRYYRYFSLHEFAWRGQRIHNHNHLLDRCEGMDGIKTGYTVASGFNLLSSVKRDGHYIVSVVMGGKSARARDNFMEALIERHIADGGSPRGFSRIAESGAGEGAASYAPAPSAPQNGFSWWGGRDDEPRRAEAEPKPAPTPAPVPAPVRSAAAQPASQAAPEAPRLQVAAVIPSARPRPAYVAAVQEAEGDEDTPPTAAIPRRRAPADGSTSHAAASASAPSATPTAKTTLRVAMAEPPVRPKPDAGVSVLPKSAAKTDSASKTDPAPVAVGKPAVSGWVIQIGATDDAGKAAALLSKAKSQKGALLASAHAFTETVRRGNETLYRARFAGLEESKAEAACKALKSSGFSCFASRN
jgi:D-alanyl-D-alanine carboxypeptidase